MEYRILGPLEVDENGRKLPLGPARRRALLAVLLTRANEVVSTDRLADILWAGSPPPAAANVVQGHVSDLRKELGREAIVTRADGYAITVDSEQLDLWRFERLLEEGSRALEAGRAADAAECLRDALALWRGRALADVADEPSLRAEVDRLEELRLVALERRIEADLGLARHAELVGELEALVREHPLRERPQAQLMLALYRSGRQVEALETYGRARQTLVEGFGLEPSPRLQELQRAILSHDRELEILPTTGPRRSILLVTFGAAGADALLPVAVTLALQPPRELIIAGLVCASDDLGHVTANLSGHRAELLERGILSRAAAFRSPAPGEDAVRLAAEQDVDLLLLNGSSAFLAKEAFRVTLLEAPCDVAVLVDRREAVATGPVLVPFGGTDHDWAAVELGAWIAGSQGVALRLAGPEASDQDASRLLASASLAVQRVVGVAAEPLLVAPGAEGLLTAADEASLVVVGLSERWRQEGLGRVRLAIAERARPPVLVVRHGLRPGGLAPAASLTRFTWSVRPA